MLHVYQNVVDVEGGTDNNSKQTHDGFDNITTAAAANQPIWSIQREMLRSSSSGSCTAAGTETCEISDCDDAPNTRGPWPIEPVNEAVEPRT